MRRLLPASRGTLPLVDPVRPVQLPDFHKPFDVPQPGERYVLDRLPATCFRDSAGADLHGLGVSLAADLHQTDLAYCLPLWLA